MKETKMFEAVIITGSGVEILRVSNSKEQLDAFVRDYIYRYVKGWHGWGNVKVINGEDCYTVLRISNEFIAAFKIRRIACIEASPEELEEEERDREETAKNDRYAE